MHKPQWLGISQAQVNRIEKGAASKNIDTLTHWARVLRIPPDLLWCDLPDRRRVTAAGVHELFESGTAGTDTAQLTLVSDGWWSNRRNSWRPGAGGVSALVWSPRSSAGWHSSGVWMISWLAVTSTN
ncbi:MAG: helix-turn-helix transcriptional regulator [Pseudonocardiales bacterium]|nr:helix-turn-helix transcriptional regulator [Pseudonocardiales bacterium]